MNNFSIYGPLAPYLTGSGNPLSGLFRYKDESWKINNQGSIYGRFAVILNNPMNPFFHNFYIWDKLVQAAQKAWQTGNIWDFFDYEFYHFYGYSNLDKVWGGGNIKQVIKFLTGIDENGNMSIGHFMLLLFSIIPIGRAASVGGKFIAKYLPKAFTTLMKSRAVQTLLRNRTVQTILRGAKKYLKPLKRLGKSILDKIPKVLRNINLTDIGKGIKKISDLINLSPKTWIETIGKGFSRFPWIRSRGLQLKTKLKRWVTSKDIKHIIDGGINTLREGAKGGADFLKGVFANMTPKAVKQWVGAVPWRRNTFGWLKNLATKNKIYRDIHGILSPIIKRNAALRSVYDAAKTVNETVKKIPEAARKVVNTAKTVAKTAKKAARKVVNTAKTVAKTAKKAASKFVNTAKKAVKTVAKTAKKAASKFVNTAKKAVKTVAKTAKKAANKVVKTVKKAANKVVNTVKKAVKTVANTAKKVVNAAKNTISSGINWFKKKTGWF